MCYTTVLHWSVYIGVLLNLYPQVQEGAHGLQTKQMKVDVDLG